MSYFRDNIDKMAGYTPGFQPANLDVVKLNTNENPYPPSPKVMEALAGITPESLRRYPDPIGNEFRIAAAKLNGVNPENIICTNGGDDLLTIVVRAFCDKNHPLAYPVPTYTLYPALAQIQDCPVIEVPFNGDFLLPTGLKNTNAALTIVCNPNAPTGTYLPPLVLTDLAAKIKGVLLIDEAYVDFAPESCASIIKELDNVIILRSMSKGYSLAGLRFGYGIACKSLIDGLMKVKDSYNVNAITIKAATAAISDQTYFNANVEKIKAERARLTAEIRKIGFEVADSHSNFMLAKCPDGNGQKFFDELIKRNIFVRYWSSPDLADKLRITVGTPQQNDRLIEALKEIINK
jgi:histidinol-phosphate aminotransferase